jgi:hypothetical protein
MLYLDVLRALVFAVLYGLMENRVFFEGDMDYSILKHFKLYHLCMFGLFAIVSSSVCFVTWVFGLLVMPLVQDASWFVFEGRMPRKDDWTNWGGFPLLFGLPLWYWITGLILLISAVAFV